MPASFITITATTFRNRVKLMIARLLKWEFWPAWIFYPPVALYCVWQGIKQHSFSLPAVANLNQKNGGIVGESKIGILSELMTTSPELTAEAFLVEADSAAILARDFSVDGAMPNSLGTSIPKWLQINRMIA